jgi:hypothetical protein
LDCKIVSSSSGVRECQSREFMSPQALKNFTRRCPTQFVCYNPAR